VWNIAHIGAGTIFWLGKQKLVKNNQDNQIQSVTLRDLYFSKKVYTVYKAPEVGEFLRIFVFNVTLPCKVTFFNCKLQKKMGEHDVLVAALIILLGEHLLPD